MEGGFDLEGKHVVASTLGLGSGGREHVVGDLLVAIVNRGSVLFLLLSSVVGLDDGESLLVDLLILVLLEFINLHQSVGLLNEIGIRKWNQKKQNNTIYIIKSKYEIFELCPKEPRP